MGVRGEIFSTRLILPNRTYFLNVKENRVGDLYLNIVESKNKDIGGFERQSVIVFADDLPAFLGEFDKALKRLEKTAREQKQNGKSRPPDRKNDEENRRPRRDNRPDYRSDNHSDNRPRRDNRPDYRSDNHSDNRPRRDNRPDYRSDNHSGNRPRRDNRPDYRPDDYSGNRPRRDNRPDNHSDNRPDRKRIVYKKNPTRKD